MSKRVVVMFMAVFALTTGYVLAETMDKPADAAVAAATPDAAVASGMAAPVEVNNTICPISGETLDPATAEKVTYKGKVYNVCTKGKEAFDKDSEQFADKFAALDASMEKAEAPADEAAAPAEEESMKEDEPAAAKEAAPAANTAY